MYFKSGATSGYVHCPHSNFKCRYWKRSGAKNRNSSQLKTISSNALPRGKCGLAHCNAFRKLLFVSGTTPSCLGSPWWSLFSMFKSAKWDNLYLVPFQSSKRQISVKDHWLLPGKEWGHGISLLHRKSCFARKENCFRTHSSSPKNKV